MTHDQLVIELQRGRRLDARAASTFEKVRDAATGALPAGMGGGPLTDIHAAPAQKGRGGPPRRAERGLELDDVLPQDLFARQVEREKRRTDRSKLPLSLATFRLNKGTETLVRECWMLLDSICDTKRETDVVGFLADDLIAALLPDTDKNGAEVVIAKVLESVGNSRVSAASVTYPDELFDQIVARQEADNSCESFLYAKDQGGAPKGTYRLKRAIDVVGALAALTIFSPVMLVVAVAVAATSPGPIIYKQIRLGRKGNPFSFYKFRSMHCNADDRIHREYVKNLIDGKTDRVNQGDAAKPVYKIKSDPRITAIGRIIRKTSLDELPQLFNVLKGDMSLVGPRPPIPYEAEKYQAWHLRRILEVEPGITGMWQVEGRSRTTFDEMVRMDLRYIRHCSLALDLKILAKTVSAVLRCDGAK